MLRRIRETNINGDPLGQSDPSGGAWVSGDLLSLSQPPLPPRRGFTPPLSPERRPTLVVILQMGPGPPLAPQVQGCFLSGLVTYLCQLPRGDTAHRECTSYLIRRYKKKKNE